MTLHFLMALAVAGRVKTKAFAHRFLGMIMIGLAVYFLLFLMIIPQFSDLDKIYRISTKERQGSLSREKSILSLVILASLFCTTFKKYPKIVFG